MPIPEAVSALDGYGLGVNDSCYNSIEWTDDGRVLYIRRIGVVDMGSITWSPSKGGNDIVLMYSKKIFDMVSNISTATVGNVLCAPYNTIKANAVYYGAIGISNNEGNLYLYDPNYTDADIFKNAMSGVMLYYDLAEPIVTDITDMITSDNYIGVEGNGTVTMVNEHGYAVPSEITYQIKQGEVTA